MLTDEAFVLRTAVWQDQHLIVSLFTQQEGRQEALAYGSRSARSRVARVYFQPLNWISVSFSVHPNRSSLRKLDECSFRELSLQTFDPVKFLYRQFIAELLATILHAGYPQPAMWHLVRTYTSWLGSTPRGLYIGTVWFLVQLAEHLGFGLEPEWLSLELKSGHPQISFEMLENSSRTIVSYSSYDLASTNQLVLEPELRLQVLELLSYHVLENLGNTRPLRTLEHFAELRSLHRKSGSNQ